MAASMEEGGAMYGHIGWGCAYELSSFYLWNVSFLLTKRTAAHPTANLR